MAASVHAHVSPDFGEVLPAEVWAEVFVRLDRPEDRVNMLKSRKAWLECPVILSHIQRLVVDEDNADLTTFQPELATIQRLHIVTMEFPTALFYHIRLSSVTEVCIQGEISRKDLYALTCALPGLRKLDIGLHVTGERCVLPLSRLTKLEELVLGYLIFGSDDQGDLTQTFVREMNHVLACTPVLSMKMDDLQWMTDELSSITVRHIICTKTSVLRLEAAAANCLAPRFPALQRVSIGGIYLFDNTIDPQDMDEWIEKIEMRSVLLCASLRARPLCWDIVRLCPEFKLRSLSDVSDNDYVNIQHRGKRFDDACTRVLDDIMRDDRIVTQAASVVTCLDLEAMYLTHETVDVLARCFVSVRRLRLRNRCFCKNPTVLGRLIMEMPNLSVMEVDVIEVNDVSATRACVSLAVMTCRNHQRRSVHVMM